MLNATLADGVPSRLGGRSMLETTLAGMLETTLAGMLETTLAVDLFDFEIDFSRAAVF